MASEKQSYHVWAESLSTSCEMGEEWRLRWRSVQCRKKIMKTIWWPFDDKLSKEFTHTFTELPNNSKKQKLGLLREEAASRRFWVEICSFLFNDHTDCERRSSSSILFFALRWHSISNLSFRFLLLASSFVNASLRPLTLILSNITFIAEFQ